jgi:hypothetical protein
MFGRAPVNDVASVSRSASSSHTAVSISDVLSNAGSVGSSHAAEAIADAVAPLFAGPVLSLTEILRVLAAGDFMYEHVNATQALDALLSHGLEDLLAEEVWAYHAQLVQFQSILEAFGASLRAHQVAGTLDAFLNEPLLHTLTADEFAGLVDACVTYCPTIPEAFFYEDLR